MNQRSRLTLYVLAGLYLFYTGGKLVLEVIKGQPENFFVYLICGVVFLISGAGLAIFSAKEYYEGDYFHKTGDDDSEEDTESSEESTSEVAEIEVKEEE